MNKFNKPYQVTINRISDCYEDLIKITVFAEDLYEAQYIANDWIYEQEFDAEITDIERVRMDLVDWTTVLNFAQ